MGHVEMEYAVRTTCAVRLGILGVHGEGVPVPAGVLQGIDVDEEFVWVLWLWALA
jgi:hypothetical protein